MNMLNVFICEDNPPQKNKIENCVESCITIHNMDMKIALSTDDPNAVLRYIEKQPICGLYFLDIELNSNISGLELAEMIRKHDPRGFIVFITTHSESQSLVFKYKLEAMDYILKDDFIDFKARIHECVLNAHERYSSKANELQKTFSFKVSDKLMTVDFSKILYFETSVNSIHKIQIHTTYGVFEFYGSLRKLKEDLDDSFFQCHHSCIINLRQDLNLDLKGKTVHYNKNESCSVSSRKLKQLVKLLENVKRDK